jgi:hypothetical protein
MTSTARNQYIECITTTFCHSERKRVADHRQSFASCPALPISSDDAIHGTDSPSTHTPLPSHHHQTYPEILNELHTNCPCSSPTSSNYILHAMSMVTARSLRTSSVPQTTSMKSAKTQQFGQELLSTFGTQIGEIALIPATGGLFQVELVSKRRVDVAVLIRVSRRIFRQVKRKVKMAS